MNLEAIHELDEYIKNGKENFLDLAPNFEAFTDLLSTEMVKKIKQLQGEKKDLLLTYTPNDDRVKVVDKKLKDHTDYLVESIQNTKKKPRNEIQKSDHRHR
jgi:CRISPR/Cas system endoribonuclease Cas6 (RAMP superfamily)